MQVKRLFNLSLVALALALSLTLVHSALALTPAEPTVEFAFEFAEPGSVIVNEPFSVIFAINTKNTSFGDGEAFIAMNENFFEVLNVTEYQDFIPTEFTSVISYANADPALGTAIDLAWTRTSGTIPCQGQGNWNWFEIKLKALQATDGVSGFSALWMPVECSYQPYATYIELCDGVRCYYNGLTHDPFYIKAYWDTNSVKLPIESKTWSEIKELY